jgi:hypothetical protein
MRDCRVGNGFAVAHAGPVFHSWEEHPPFLLLLDVRQKTAGEDSAGPGRAIQIAELADC